MMRRLHAALLALMLTGLAGCGYHLVGQGESSVLPAGASLVVRADDETGRNMAKALARMLIDRGYSLARDTAQASTYVLHIRHVTERFLPVAYDASGLAVQYRLSLRADATLIQGENERWRSDTLHVQGDVFANGGPTEIDAQRSQVRRQLQEAWVRKCLARLLSGF